MSAVNVVRAGLRIAVLAVLARLLTPRDFGLVAAAGAVVWLCTIFSSLGVGPALVQRTELETRHVQTGFASSLLLGLGLALAAWAGAPALATLFRMPDLVPVLRVLGLVLPVAALSVVGESLLQRELRFGTIARIELFAYALGYGAVGVVLAFQGYGVWALVAAEMGKTIVKAAAFLVAAPHSKRLRFDPGAFRELFRFGSGYTVTSLSMYFALQGDNLVVARMLGAATLGIYSRAYELMLVPAKMLGDMLHRILFPVLARVQHDPPRLGAAFRRGLAIVALAVLPVSVVTVVLAPEIVRTLLGPQWGEVVRPLQILSAAMYFQIGYMIAQSVTHAAGAVYRTAWRSVAFAVLVLAGALVGQRWGLSGVAVGVVVAITGKFLLMLQLGARLTGVRLYRFAGPHAPALLLAAAAGAMSWLVAEWLRGASAPALAVLSAAGAAAAVTVLLLMRFAPRVALGTDGAWLAGSIHDAVPAAVRPLVRWAFGVPTP